MRGRVPLKSRPYKKGEGVRRKDGEVRKEKKKFY